MISIAKSVLALVPALSVALAQKVPAPVPFNRSSMGSYPVNPLTSRAANCDHCFTCFYFEPPGRVLSFVGNLYVPSNNPSDPNALNYVWPGVLTNSDVATVLQTVIDGFPEDNGAWTKFQNWLAGKPDNYGVHQNNSVPVSVGEKLSFSMTISSDGKSWDIDSNGAKNNYAIHDDFIYAAFCGEFYKSGWNFGDLVFENVQIVAQTTDASWCVENGQAVLGSPTGQWTDVSHVTDSGNNVVCNIGKLVMNTQ